MDIQRRRSRAAKSSRNGLRLRYGPGDALFDTKHYADVLKDLVEAGLVTPLAAPPGLAKGRALGRIELPPPAETAEDKVPADPGLEDVVGSE